MKKLIAFVLTFTLLAGCAVCAEGMSLADKYISYSFTAEGYGDFNHYFHFYPEAPVLGSVFYAGFVNNQTCFAGTYTVEEKECAYTVFENRKAIEASAEKLTGVAPYTITFYDFAGNVLDECAFDGTYMYNDMDVVKGTSSGPVIYSLDADRKLQSAYDGELGVNYLSFVADDDDTCTVQLSHNMTYVDLMSFIVEGKWSMAARDDGGYDYTLSPDLEGDVGAVLGVSADRLTAVYTSDEGDVWQMTNTEALGPNLAYVGLGEFHIDAYGIDAQAALNMYDDGSCELLAELFGNSAALDAGEYVMNADYSVSFDFDNAGDLTARVDPEKMALLLDYACDKTQIGAINVSLQIGQAEAPAPEMLLEVAGGFTTIAFYDDFTYEFKFESYGLTEKGTWGFANYALSLTQSNGNVINATLDPSTYALSLIYVAEANAALTDTYTVESAVWGTAFVK